MSLALAIALIATLAFIHCRSRLYYSNTWKAGLARLQQRKEKKRERADEMVQEKRLHTS
jgi:hypothetical protein